MPHQGDTGKSPEFRNCTSNKVKRIVCFYVDFFTCGEDVCVDTSVLMQNLYLLLLRIFNLKENAFAPSVIAKFENVATSMENKICPSVKNAYTEWHFI